MLVYIVTAGEYSDYSIRGVFVDQAKAQGFADAEREAQIEIWDTDRAPGMTDTMTFRSLIDLETGEITRHDYGDYDYAQRVDGSEMEYITGDPLKIMVTSGKSLEHADKLAAKARQRWLRSKPGGCPMKVSHETP